MPATLQDAANKGVTWQIAGDRFLFQVPRIARFLLSGGREILFEPAPGAEAGDGQHSQLRQKLPGWSGHVASWLEQSDIPIHLIRYEDLQADTLGTLRRALNFAGRPASEDDMRRAVAFADFAQLRQQEQDKGFHEAPRPWTASNFFRRGEAGGWRDELSAEQAARIESDHANMMRRMGYPLTSMAALALTG